MCVDEERPLSGPQLDFGVTDLPYGRNSGRYLVKEKTADSDKIRLCGRPIWKQDDWLACGALGTVFQSSPALHDCQRTPITGGVRFVGRSENDCALEICPWESVKAF